MQLVAEPPETSDAIGNRLTDLLFLSSGFKFKSDEDRLTVMKKLAKPGNYVMFHGRGGYSISLSNKDKDGFELLVRDTSSQLSFDYKPDGSFKNSKRINLHAESDGCTRLDRVGLEVGKEKGFGDEILDKIYNYEKNRKMIKGKLVFPPAICVPTTKKP